MHMGLTLGLQYRQASGGGDAGIPFASDLFAYFDFSDTSSITESDGSVSIVTGQLGTTVTASQSTPSLQPTSGSETISGKNVLTVDADPLHLSQKLPSTATVHMVVELDSVDATQSLCGEIVQAGGAVFCPIFQDGSGNTSIFLNVTAANLAKNGVVVTPVDRDAAYDLFVNDGTDVGPVVVSWTGDMSVIDRILAPNNTSLGMAGKAGAFVCYNVEHDSTQIGQVASWLMTEWGIT